MLTTNDPIGDILARVKYLEENGGMYRRTIDEIIVQNGYANKPAFDRYHNIINRDGRTFNLKIQVQTNDGTSIWRYTVMYAKFGNIDGKSGDAFSPLYNDGFPIGFYIRGYQNNSMIRIGARSNNDYQFLLSLYNSFR